MSAIPTLRAAARSAYRDLLRASASTFAGKLLRMRTEALALSEVERNDPARVGEKIQLAKELAVMLRRNVVQARRIESDTTGETWSLRFTKDTELGDNSTIKNPPPLQSGRRTRKDGKGDTVITEPAAPPEPSPPRNYSALKKAHKQREIPELREEDLEESFVRGSGPGGQSINKTKNNVQLLHKPTGIRVSCQETRSLQTNRMLARRQLLQKLDQICNPGLSKTELQRAKKLERERQRRKKAKKKARQKGTSSSE
ncbi:RF-1 domain-containing protein [Pisolithus croceorrhizus]|nr:RF-1 domain-containing protein [Pisolithus croceorrhizus]